MTTLFLRTSLNFLALCCLVLMSLDPQCHAQVLDAFGNSQVTPDAAEIFSTGAREILIDGTLDLEIDTFEDPIFFVGDGVDSVAFFGRFPVLAENSSAISIGLQNESGVVIGTLTSSTLNELNFVAVQGLGRETTFEVAFTFGNAAFTSTDASTAGIVAESFTITSSDLSFPGEVGFPTGINPDDFLANLANGDFSIDESNVQIAFTNGGTNFIEEVGILQSDPNQQFSLFPITTLLGDINLDGQVDFLDISPFISVLASRDFQAEADINEDGLVNFLDIFLLISVFPGA